MSALRSAHWRLLLLICCLTLATLPAPAAAVEGTPQPERYIVQLDGEPLAAFAAQIASVAEYGRAEHPSLTSQPVQAQRARLADRRQGVIAAIGRRIGADPLVSYVYDAAFNGIAVDLTPGQARAIAGLAGVVAVQPEQIYTLDTDAGPAWIGADQIWDGSVTDGYKGEGVIIGVLDTGINTAHPSFAEVGGDGYRHLNPLGQGVFRGACDPSNLPAFASGNPSGYNPAVVCNNKLIGAWTFRETAVIGNLITGEPSPNDNDGHGSHTASTAAGNVLTNVRDDGVIYPRISGVAPHANIIAYDVCGYQNESGYYTPDCPEAAVLAAINQAILDQVDVINYSISGGSSPWEDPVEQAFLNARAAGIVVSTSAGNSGPMAGTVAHQSPWLLTVAASTHNREISGTTRVLDSAYADIMAKFSSRGPTSGQNADLLKPDLTAPGVAIFAAYANSGGESADYALSSGTSMAAPHVAGAAALLAGLHPDWTPGQIQSALMTTGLAALKKEDKVSPTTPKVSPTTPFDSGAGRVRLERAALAGLTLDQTVDDFRAANPALGGAPRDLNLPGMADAHCVVACTWTRTVRNTLGVPATWAATSDTSSLAVTPKVFTIAAGGDQTLTFTMDVSAKPVGAYVFGRATLSATGGLAPDVSFPVAALPQISDLPVTRTFTSAASSATDTLAVETVAYSSLGAQVYGMTRGTAHSFNLTDGGADTSTTLTVPANTSRLVAEIRASTSQDVDLYLISDSHVNGVPDMLDTVVCQSAVEAVEEYCSVDSPAAGTYFVSVENYTASQAGGTDRVDLLTAVVPKSPAGNLSVEAPASSGAGTINVRLNVNAPTSTLGDYWYAQVRLTDTASARLLGVMSFDFHRLTNAATALTVSGGSGQHTVVSTIFPAPLTVTLTNSTGGRIANAAVTFSAPGSGASATFLGGDTAITNSNGVAQVMARANGLIGSYQVTASAAGASGQLTARFALENTEPRVHVYLPLVWR